LKPRVKEILGTPGIARQQNEKVQSAGMSCLAPPAAFQ
jgi:hypothetical protein